jgi:hypothetical protein
MTVAIGPVNGGDASGCSMLGARRSHEHCSWLPFAGYRGIVYAGAPAAICASITSSAA